MSDGDRLAERTPRECPTCSAEMDHHGVSGTDHRGRDVDVTWDVCPECETIVDDFGSVLTKRDQQHAQAIAEKINRDAMRRVQ